MNILFHCAVGNGDAKPKRWSPIGVFYTKLANSLEKLGHKCLIYIHPQAAPKCTFHNKIISETVQKLENFQPDKIITWNGIFSGDNEIIKLYGREKFIFMELGFFDHYDTCYFDFSGTNYRSMNIIESISVNDYDWKAFENLVSKYKKHRICKDRYVFVPLQDESDTQITKLSPF